MWSSRRAAGAPVCAVIAAMVMSLSQARAELRIDAVEASDFDRNRTIRVFFDALDQGLKVIEGLKPDEVVAVTIDGKKVDGDITLQTFEQAKEWVAVAVLMAGHRSYAQTFDAVGDDVGGAEQTAEPSTFERQKVGVSNFIRQLSGGDRVAVYRFDERGMRPVVAWTGDFTTASRKVERAEKCPEDECRDGLAPRFFQAVQEVVGKTRERSETDDGFPRRQIVLVMSNGVDKDMNNRRRLEQRIATIGELARDSGVKLYTLGYTEEEAEALVPLGQLASATQGVYREIPSSADKAEIPTYFSDLGKELKRQYVMDFVPDPEVFNGAERPVKVRVDIRANGEDHGAEFDNVKVNMPPYDPMPLVMWILVGLGSLLGLFLVFKLVKAILVARANRPVEVVGPPPEEPVGRYMARLVVLEGSAGRDAYYITNDVTTIGSLDGNDITLHEVPGVSKRHAGVKVDDMRFELADFASLNGTFVNGHKINKQFLRDGDVVRVGDCQMRFSLK